MTLSCPDCRASIARGRDCACDLGAREWLRDQGLARSTIPSQAGTGRLRGGHVSDVGRGGTQAQLSGLAASQGVEVQRVERTSEATPAQGHPLRHYAEWLRARIRVLRPAMSGFVAELRRLELHVRLVEMRLDGDGIADGRIARRLGWSRTRVVETFGEITADAARRGMLDLPDLATPCRWRKCRGLVEGKGGRGRPRIYCTAGCEENGKKQAQRDRARAVKVSRKVSRKNRRSNGGAPRQTAHQV